ncbi:MAG TPA: pyridoxal-phosphate dependent enzyme [Candidatus Angelobacter sp.]
MNLEWSSVQAARQFLQRHFAQTRVVPATSLSRGVGPRVYFKLESELPTGSFKVRGALYALYTELNRRPVAEVVASSTGNHGAAVAYAAKVMGIPARIFLPANANPAKQMRIREQGAEIVEGGKDISDAAEAAQDYARRSSAFFLNDASNADIPAGTATIALEILEQLPGVTAVWVPVGDTALSRGIACAAKHLRPEIRIIGVQAERAPSYYLSWKRGVPVPTATCDTIADGLATRTPLKENVTAIRELVDDIRLVSEEQMLGAIEHLAARERIIAEPAAAATTAAWLASAESRGSGTGTVVLLITGANISEPVLRLAMNRSVNEVSSNAVPEPQE